MASVGHWKPIRDTHAIQMAAIGVSFADSIPSRSWDRLRTSAAQKAQQLGLERQEQQAAIQFVVGPHGQMPAVQPSNAPVSVNYMRMERQDFFSDRLTIGRQGARYEEWSYTRWAALLEKATTAIEEGFVEYSDAPMSTIYVDYADVFVNEQPESVDRDCGEVIDRASGMVASAAFDRSNPWHTYSGHFSKVAPDVRRLHQVNIDVSDIPYENIQVRAIQIRTIITDQINMPGLEPFGVEKQNWTVVREHLDGLHRVANDTVTRILTESAANAISLRVE